MFCTIFNFQTRSRIETNKRYVTDVELKALTEIFHVSYEYLIEGKEEKS